jgi:crotonobetainyl-CoA:carnitine CoA-transferase CaiB-like acyl-CoA transferase
MSSDRVRASGRLRAVEIARDIGAPALGRILAALGHDVIKCEPPDGDPLRRREPLDEAGVGLAFTALNADKRSVVADPVDPDGRARIHALLDGADLLITDRAPDAAAGLDAEEFTRRWPSLVTVSITGFGLTGDRANRDADSLLAESYGGLATMIGGEGGRPLSLGGEQSAHAAAVTGLLGAMLALHRRDRAGGGGELVDVALCDVAAYMDWKSDIGFAATGRVTSRAGASRRRWRMVRAADGWIGVIFQPDQWPALVRLVADDRLTDPRLAHDETRLAAPRDWWPVIEEWAATKPKKLIYHDAQRLGLPFGYCADVADLVASCQLHARGFLTGAGPGAPAVGAPVSAAELPWSHGPAPALGQHQNHAGADWDPPATRGTLGSPSSRPAPLDGLIVLDFGTITAGAATSRLLADYGATVIKVEGLSHPDPFRRWTPPGSARSVTGAGAHGSPLFASNNAGKLSVTLDLRTEQGKAQAHRLAARADVVVENFRVGVTEQLGIDRDTLHRINPQLIYLSLSSQGQRGPEARYRSYGSTLDLLSGLASVTGHDRTRPIWSSSEVNYPDQIVAIFGAALVAYCLQQGIRGTHLDVAQRDVVSWTLADRIADFQQNGRIAAPEGNRRPGRTPHDIYPCASPDTWIAISCRTAAQRQALARLVAPTGQPPAEDWWAEHDDEVDAAITTWTHARTREDCDADLAAAEVPCAPVLTAADRAAEPHFRDRRVFLNTPERLKGFPLLMRHFTPSVPAPAPGLGTDTDRVISTEPHGPTVAPPGQPALS